MNLCLVCSAGARDAGIGRAERLPGEAASAPRERLPSARLRRVRRYGRTPAEAPGDEAQTHPSLLLLPWPPSLPFPPSLPRRRRPASLLAPLLSTVASSRQCLPCPITGHRPRACSPLPPPPPPSPLSPPSLSPRSSLSFSKPAFPAKRFFFPFQWLSRDQEAVGYAEAHLAGEGESVQESCPCLLLQTTRSFTQKTLRQKPQTATLPALFIRGETGMSVFHFE